MKKIAIYNFVILLMLTLFLPAFLNADRVVDGRKFFNLSERSTNIGSDGVMHVAYGSDHLYHAWKDGATWQREIVDTVSVHAKDIDMLTDSSGLGHIIYSYNTFLMHAYQSSEKSWSIETIDTMYGVDGELSASIDLEDKIHVAYGSGTSVAYATNSSGSWVDSISKSGVSTTDISIDVDSSEKVHIAYIDGADGKVFYTNNTGSSWSISKLIGTSNTGNYVSVSIAVNNNGEWIISYIGSDGKLKAYIYFPLKDQYYSVSSDELDVGCKYSVSVSYKGDYPFVLFFDTSDGKLKYAEMTLAVQNLFTGDYVNTYWSIINTNLTYSTSSYNSLSLATSANEIFYIGHDYEDRKINGGVKTDSGSYPTIVDVGDLGTHSSIAVDGDGYSHVSYYDPSISDLMYATNKSGIWFSQTVDTAGGKYNTIAVDNDGVVHISYVNTGSYDNLMYATNPRVTWVIANISPTTSSNTYSLNDIALSNDGEVYISAYDFRNNHLYYFTDISGSWNNYQIIGDDLSIGEYNSIAKDSSDRNVDIVFYNSENPSLVLAHGDMSTGSMTTTTITNLEEAIYPSIAFDLNEKIHVGYYNQSTEKLMYTTNRTGSWQQESVGDFEFIIDTDIAIDGNNDVYISYDNSTQVGYATNESNSWISNTTDNTEHASMAIGGNHLSLLYYQRADADLYTIEKDIEIKKDEGINPAIIMYLLN